MADIARADAAHQAAKRSEKPARAARTAAFKAAPNRFNSFPQRAYNIDQLETELLNTQ